MPSPLTGSAGEHYVLYRLLREGAIAALAPERAPNVDVIVTDQSAKTVVAIQVKTRRTGQDGGWHLKPKHEELAEEKFVYCFVDFEDVDTNEPVVYVVPSKVVASTLKVQHKLWKDIPGQHDQKRNDSSVRRLLPSYDRILRTPPNFLRQKRPDWRKNYSDFLKDHQSGWLEHYRENWKPLGL